MSEDIVTRLRGQRTNGVLCEQAADEIERLRAELWDFKQHAIHAWFCKEQVCEICFEYFIEAKHGGVADHE